MSMVIYTLDLVIQTSKSGFGSLNLDVANVNLDLTPRYVPWIDLMDCCEMNLHLLVAKVKRFV